MSKEPYAPFLTAMKKLAEVQELLSHGQATIYVEQMVGAYEYLMNRFAPFWPGDTVMLLKAPDPMPSGWVSCSHYLKPGSLAIVKHVSCDGKGFRVEVEFLDESWINSAGEVILLEQDRRHTFSFSDVSFVKVP